MKTCQLHCTPVSVSNAGYSGLSSGLYTGISVSDKVYEDQCQLHCYPVYQSVSKVLRPVTWSVHPNISQRQSIWRPASSNVHCTPMSVTWGIHLEYIDLPEYQSATKYTNTCQLDCYPVYQSVTRDITACQPELFWNIDQRQSIWKYVRYCVPRRIIQ